MIIRFLYHWYGRKVKPRDLGNVLEKRTLVTNPIPDDSRILILKRNREECEMKKSHQHNKKTWIPILSALFALTAAVFPSSESSHGRPVDENRKPVIAVLGSSLAAGWVTSREARFDMQNGWAFRLERLLTDRGYKILNIAQPGDTTEKVLARLDKDLFPLAPDFVIISLSLENEGIRGIGGKIPDKIYEGFKSNLQTIIQRCREKRIVPIVASCYPSDNYTEDWHYRYIKAMNLELAAWNVPGINLLGALDNGRGGFIEGVTFDLDHPDSRGHAELFFSIVPGLFKALSQGVPIPAMASGTGFFSLKESSHPAPLSFIPEDPLHSFTVSFDIKPGSSGILAAIQNESGTISRLRWNDEDGTVIYESHSADPADRAAPFLKRSGWHNITLSHRHLNGKTLIFLDGRTADSVDETILPVHMVLGGSGQKDKTGLPLTADFRNWMIYRSALNEDEAALLAEGKLLQPSLDLYIPLDEKCEKRPQILKNYAQSTSRASAYPESWEDQVAEIKRKINALEQSEKIFIDPNAKKPVEIDSGIFDELTGDFAVDDHLVLTVAKENKRLFLLFNGGDMGKLELFPLSPNNYFMRIVGPDAEAEFKKDKAGAVTEIKLTIGPTTIIGKKSLSCTDPGKMPQRQSRSRSYPRCQ